MSDRKLPNGAISPIEGWYNFCVKSAQVIQAANCFTQARSRSHKRTTCM
ncbi:hypothetical protein [Microcoleus sp. Pol12B4]